MIWTRPCGPWRSSRTLSGELSSALSVSAPGRLWMRLRPGPAFRTTFAPIVLDSTCSSASLLDDSRCSLAICCRPPTFRLDWISTFRATRIPPWTRSAGNGADESSRLETTVGPPATTNAPPPADTVKVPFRFSMNARCCPFSSSTRDAASLPDLDDAVALRPDLD